MMNERDAQRLLEMAHEAERLERDLSGAMGDASPLLEGRGRGVLRGSSTRWGYWRAAIAACAAFVLVFGASWLQRSMSKGTVTTIASRGGHKAKPAADHATMLIALFAGDEQSNAAEPECWCLQRFAPVSGGDVASMAPEELIAASMERACVTSPRQVVVIGLSGPREHLPASDDEARSLAKCLLGDGASVGSGDVCLASSVDLRVQRWSNQ